MTYPYTRRWRVWALQWPCRLVLQSDPALLCSLQEFHQSQEDLEGLSVNIQVRCRIKKSKETSVLHSLHAGTLYRCCSSLKSLSHEFLTITVRACRVYFLTESSRSCQISNALSSPSTVSFTSMLFNCGRIEGPKSQGEKKKTCRNEKSCDGP